MLLNPKAVERLRLVTRARGYWYHTYQTHNQRNEWARMFLEEARKLLDQQAEQTIKHIAELYCTGEISYERYNEQIEQISKEEEERGALQGGAYARNHVFDFAQKAVDREKERLHALALTLVVMLFLSVPLWISTMVIVIVALIFLTIVIWKNPISERTLLHNRKEIERFQTQSDDYDSLSEEERCTLLTQRMITI